MTRWILQILVAITTFTVGLALAPKPITFSGDYQMSGFRERYFSSDGEALLFHGGEFDSPSKARLALREETIGKRIIEWTSSLDANGRKIGERVLFVSGAAPETDVELYWTKGAAFCWVMAPSVKHAELFERSKAWTDRCH